MQININCHHIELTQSIKEYATEKLAKLGNHLDRVTVLNLTLSVEKLRHIAKAALIIPGDALHAEAESADLYAAIDILVDKLDRQAIRHKGKQQNHHKHKNKHSNQDQDIA